MFVLHHFGHPCKKKTKQNKPHKEPRNRIGELEDVSVVALQHMEISGWNMTVGATLSGGIYSAEHNAAQINELLRCEGAERALKMMISRYCAWCASRYPSHSNLIPALCVPFIRHSQDESRSPSLCGHPRDTPRFAVASSVFFFCWRDQPPAPTPTSPPFTDQGNMGQFQIQL